MIYFYLYIASVLFVLLIGIAEENIKRKKFTHKQFKWKRILIFSVLAPLVIIVFIGQLIEKFLSELAQILT